MISVMLVSGWWALGYKTQEVLRSSKLQDEKLPESAESEGLLILRNLAVSQLLLTLLTLTTAHVQIITRISSAYPVCLWYLSAQLEEGTSPLAGNVVRFMVIYAIVQGGLFASFLPPA
jgi:phosphatidylinositol glycan class V